MTFWPEKFFADTADLSPDAAAYYLLMLTHAWVRGGSLPNDPDKIRLMLRLSKQRWLHLRTELLERWSVGADGRLHQKRMDEEWGRAERRREMAAAAHNKNDAALQNSKKPRKSLSSSKAKNQMISTRAHAHDPTPTPTVKNSLVPSESSSLARAPLCVRGSHAAPALRLVESTEPSQPPEEFPLTDERRDQIVAEQLAAFHATVAGASRKDIDEIAAGTKADLEQRKAEDKLAALAAEKPTFVLSSSVLATPLMADHAKTA